MHSIIQLNKQHSKKALYLEFQMYGSQRNVLHACQRLREYFRISFLIIISYLSFLFLPFPSFGFFSSFFFLENEAGKKSKWILFFINRISKRDIQRQHHSNCKRSQLLYYKLQLPEYHRNSRRRGEKTTINHCVVAKKSQKYTVEPLYNDFLGIVSDYLPQTVKYIEKNLDITKHLYSEHILPVPRPSRYIEALLYFHLEAGLQYFRWNIIQTTVSQRSSYRSN